MAGSTTTRIWLVASCLVASLNGYKAANLQHGKSALIARQDDNNTTQQYQNFNGTLSSCDNCSQTSKGVKRPTQADVIVHLFEWRWEDVALECEKYLGPMGYSAVQVSPATEDIGDFAAGQSFPEWYTRYQPVSYKIISRSGSEAAFKDMVSRCRAVGVDIIVDVVLNHMAAGGNAGLNRSSPFPSDRHFPAVPYDCSHFHHFQTGELCGNCNITESDYNNNVGRVQTCDLGGLPDLDTGNAHVQQVQAELLNRLSSMGVAGVRMDATKHMNVNDVNAVWSQVRGLYANMEIIQSGDGQPYGRDYDAIGSPWEFKVPIVFADAFLRQQDLTLIQNIDSNSQYAGSHWALGNQAISFVINHDQLLHGGDRPNYVSMFNEGMYSLALQLLLAHPYGQPNILSSPAFTLDRSKDKRLSDSYDWNGIPATAPDSAQLARVFDGAGKTVGCGYWRDNTSTGFPRPYICEHRWPEVAAMVKWRRAMYDAGLTTYKAQFEAGNKVMAVSYGGSGLFMLNIGSVPFSYDGFDTYMPEGVYCNVLVPGCSSTISIGSDGRADVKLAPRSSFAISKARKSTAAATA